MNEKSKQNAFELTDHFFRHEYSKMVAVISHYFSAEDLNLAEDVVQDTLLEAIRGWELNGIPPNPTAWLYTVAKNKTLNILKRSDTGRKIKAASIHLNKPNPRISIEEMFSTNKISDDLLEMMFVCCHPSLSYGSQVVLILKTLCGFSISEIARAFLTNHGTINKRLVRARKALKKNNVQFKIPEQDLAPRISTILEAIYLLFNEGYNATKGDKLIRYELCTEAIRLTKLIAGHPKFKSYTTVHALLALMYLNSARFEARLDHEGNILEMSQQDRKKWHNTLIDKGLFHLDKIRDDKAIYTYHILATISAYHCIAPSYEETDWKSILSLYDQLLTLNNSPVVRLNRAIALAKVDGNKAAIRELTDLESSAALKNYYPLYSTLGSLLMEENSFEKAAATFKHALQLTKIVPEIKVLHAKLAECAKRKNNNESPLSLL